LDGWVRTSNNEVKTLLTTFSMRLVPRRASAFLAILLSGPPYPMQLRQGRTLPCDHLGKREG